MKSSPPPFVVVMAATDSGNGAGLSADLNTLAREQCQGLAVVTAVSAQNLDGVAAVWPLSARQVSLQAAMLARASVAAIKIGVAGTRIAALRRATVAWADAPLVWDPVLAPTGGAAFADDKCIAAMLRHLAPRAMVATPNRRELAALSRRRRLEDGVQVLQDAGVAHVLVTDAVAGATVHHLLYGRARRPMWRVRCRRRAGEYHGSGCFFSAVLCARLAWGDEVAVAAEYAHKKTIAAMATAMDAPMLGRQKLLRQC